MRIPTAWTLSYEFACHDASCAPPPVGRGGSTPGKMTPQRADKPLNANHQYTLSKFKKDGTAGAPKSEAKPLADRGLIQSISGKGRGQGNTPQWELTPKGKALLAPSRDAASTLPATVRIGGGTKVYHVVGETDTHYRVTNTPGSSITFRVAKKDASTGRGGSTGVGRGGSPASKAAFAKKMRQKRDLTQAQQSARDEDRSDGQRSSSYYSRKYPAL